MSSEARPFVHQKWTSMPAFLLAAAGGAVGLGNLWRFPFITGVNGGSAFVILYLAFVAAIGIPLMLAEMSMGRAGGQSAIGTMANLVRRGRHSRIWMAVGWLSLAIPFIGFSYYAVVAGWALDYLVSSLSEGFDATTAERSGAVFEERATAMWRQIAFHAAFIAMTAAVVARGVNAGIERAAKLLMPSLFLILVLLAGYNMTVGDAEGAIDFLLAPDFSQITPSTVLMALGQAFFSLAIGVGVLITFSAYTQQSFSLGQSAVLIATADTLIALLAGFVIFPIVFGFGLNPGEGPGLLFVTLPVGFSVMPGGQIVGFLFFLLLVFAAYTTTIGMLEPIVSYLEERVSLSRPALSWLAAGGIWLVGIAPVLSFNLLADYRPLGFAALFADMTVFDVYDFFISNLILPLNGLLIALFAGWAMKREEMLRASGLGRGAVFTYFRFANRLLAPLAILLVWLNAVAGPIEF